MTVLDQAPVTGDAGQVTGERQGRPDPEVPERARRRTFTAAYKREVLAAYEAAPDGEKGAILRREGLYSSLISEWRRARDAGALAGLKQPRGRPPATAGRADRPAAQGEGPAGAGAGQGPLRGRRAVKTSGALGDDLRERGHRARAERVTDQAIALLAPRIGTRAACRAAGVAQAAGTGGTGPARPPRRCRCRTATGPSRGHCPGGAGGDPGRAALPRFADLAPAEVWAILLDEGTYLGSQSTFYGCCAPRRDPRAPRRPPTRAVKPELAAAGPNQVYSWDITKLHGPLSGRATTCTSSSTSTPATPWAGWSPPRVRRPGGKTHRRHLRQAGHQPRAADRPR